MKYDLCIIGGAGHVGLPLGVAFANARVKTILFDINREALDQIQSGVFPFREKNGDAELQKALKKGLSVSTKPDVIRQSEHVLLVIGTPVDEYLNPDIHGITKVIDAYLPYFRNGQTLILRSTIYPGTSERIQRYFYERGKKVQVAFCPERITEGRALEELRKLPQIVSAFDSATLGRVSVLFKKLGPRTVATTSPVEAELAKLFSNAWRYIKFAVGNQFYMIANDHGLDYHRIYEAMLDGYPRNKDLPSPGFAAGPCLHKDTMQLAAFHGNNFFLGHAAMLVNEGLPNYVIQSIRKKTTDPEQLLQEKGKVRFASQTSLRDFVRDLRSHGDLKTKTVGILGMAFKGESDDPRDSLAYKLRKVARAEAKRVLATDVFIKDSSFHPLETVLAESDILILAAPHRAYAKIDPRKYPGKQFVDVWNFWPRNRDGNAATARLV